MGKRSSREKVCGCCLEEEKGCEDLMPVLHGTQEDEKVLKATLTRLEEHFAGME